MPPFWALKLPLLVDMLLDVLLEAEGEAMAAGEAITGGKPFRAPFLSLFTCKQDSKTHSLMLQLDTEDLLRPKRT